jgi:hypothetical protein
MDGKLEGLMDFLVWLYFYASGFALACVWLWFFGEKLGKKQHKIAREIIANDPDNADLRKKARFHDKCGEVLTGIGIIGLFILMAIMYNILERLDENGFP